ncbi:MAG: 6-phosphogluconolactonase [Vulcanimicrobiota bacterium]
MKTVIKRYPNWEEMSRQGAGVIVEKARKAVKSKGFFTLVLAGGNTPLRTYQILAENYLDIFPWHKTYVFWGDERMVPPGDKQSNYKSAYENMLSAVPIPENHIFRIKGEKNNPAEAAREYKKTIGEFFETNNLLVKDDKASCFPKFDLIILGMGADGHTASLFPGSNVLEEDRSWVAVSTAPETSPASRRITLTYPVINNSQVVLFLISGKKKLPLVNQVLKKSEGYEKWPVSGVKPDEELYWIINNEEENHEE